MHRGLGLTGMRRRYGISRLSDFVKTRSRGLRQGRRAISHRRPMQIARLIRRVAPRAMHGHAVIPHHQIMRAPDMGMDKFALGCVLRQIAQHGAGFGHRPAMNLPGMG